MPTHPRVLAVCVNWNGREVLPDLISSLRKSDYPELEILIVDNGSTDGSVDSLDDGIRLLRAEQNRGYAAAINLALRHAGISQGGVKASREGMEPSEEAPDYVFLLNNDLEVASDTVRRLVEYASGKVPAVLGPKVLIKEKPDFLDAAWGELTWSHVLARFHARLKPDSAKWGTVQRVELLLGCALLVKSEVFHDVGDFDERFFMYHEEVDFLYRCGLKGIPVYFCPSAEVFHVGAHGTRDRPLKRTFWVRKNTVLFLRKHRASLQRWLWFLITLELSLVWNLVSFRWRKAATIWRGVKAGFVEPMRDES